MAPTVTVHLIDDRVLVYPETIKDSGIEGERFHDMMAVTHLYDAVEGKLFHTTEPYQYDHDIPLKYDLTFALLPLAGGPSGDESGAEGPADAAAQATPRPLLKESFGERCTIRAKTVDASRWGVPKALRDNGSEILQVLEVDGKRLEEPVFLRWRAAFGVKGAPEPKLYPGKVIELVGYERGLLKGLPTWVPGEERSSPPPAHFGEFRWYPIFCGMTIERIEPES